MRVCVNAFPMERSIKCGIITCPLPSQYAINGYNSCDNTSDDIYILLWNHMTQEHDITNAYIDILREFVSAAMVKCV